MATAFDHEENTKTIAYPSWNGLPSRASTSVEGDSEDKPIPSRQPDDGCTQSITGLRSATEAFVGKSLESKDLGRTKLGSGIEQCLGTCVLDLGFKMIYLSSARQLCNNLPSWSHHRPKCDERVHSIADHFDEKDASSSFPLPSPRFPGVISAFVLRDSFRIDAGVFDGQHRLAAASLLLQRRLERVLERKNHTTPLEDNASRNLTPEEEDEIDFELVVEVWPVQSIDEVLQLFLAVNRTQPVMPDEAKLPEIPQISVHRKAKPKQYVRDTTTADDHNDCLAKQLQPINGIVTQATTVLFQKYRTMFRSSSRCSPPCLNLEVFRAKLLASQICSLLRITDSAKLLETLEDANAQLSSQPLSYWRPRTRGSLELKKAREQRFFLGLEDFRWLDELTSKVLPKAKGLSNSKNMTRHTTTLSLRRSAFMQT